MRALARFRWPAVAVAWAVCLAGWIAIWVAPDGYLASGHVRVDPAAVMSTGVGAAPARPSQILFPLRATVYSPAVLQRVASAARDAGKGPVAIEEALELAGRIDVRVGPEDDAFLIQFRDGSSDAALRGLQSLVTVLGETLRPAAPSVQADVAAPVEGETGAKRRELDAKVADIALALAAAEAALEEGRRRAPAGAAIPATGSSAYSSEYAALATQTRAELASAEAIRDGLKRRLAGEREWIVRELPLPPSQADPEPEPAPASETAADSELEARIRAVRESLELMRQKYTEEHPDVVSARHVLAILIDQRERRQETSRKAEEERRAQREAARAARLARERAATVQTRERNPAFDQIHASMSQQEVVVSGLRAKLAEYDRALQSARSQVAPTRAPGSDIGAMTREVERLRQALAETKARRDALPISGAPATPTRAPPPPRAVPSQVEAVRLVDAPIVRPAMPASTRAWGASGVLVLGVLAGFATAWVLAQRHPLFHEAESLGKMTGLPVLGSVSRFPGDARGHAEVVPRLAYMAACLALLGCYAAMLGIITHVMRLHA